MSILVCRTRAEELLAAELRARGVYFTPNGCIKCCNGKTYTPDFIIGENLLVEIMGSIHWKTEKRTYDTIRREALIGSGFKILEFLNDEVISNVKTVADKIQHELALSKALFGNFGE